MAINKNHEFEEINGVRCAIVQKLASPERVAFVRTLLEGNGYSVVIVPSPAPKAAAPAVAPVEGEATPAAPETFTIAVTDVTFNVTNAIFGRLLRTREGKVVTLAYWQEKEAVSNDEVPYFEGKG